MSPSSPSNSDEDTESSEEGAELEYAEQCKTVPATARSEQRGEPIVKETKRISDSKDQWSPLNRKGRKQHHTESMKSESSLKLKYNYKEDQWSPLYPEGKQYDRDFLLSLQDQMSSRTKPDNLPEIPDVILNQGRDDKYMPKTPSFDFFTPGYVKSASSGPGSRQPNMEPDTLQLGPGFRLGPGSSWSRGTTDDYGHKQAEPDNRADRYTIGGNRFRAIGVDPQNGGTERSVVGGTSTDRMARDSRGHPGQQGGAHRSHLAAHRGSQEMKRESALAAERTISGSLNSRSRDGEYSARSRNTSAREESAPAQEEYLHIDLKKKGFVLKWPSGK